MSEAKQESEKALQKMEQKLSEIKPSKGVQNVVEELGEKFQGTQLYQKGMSVYSTPEAQQFTQEVARIHGRLQNIPTSAKAGMMLVPIVTSLGLIIGYELLKQD